MKHCVIYRGGYKLSTRRECTCVGSLLEGLLDSLLNSPDHCAHLAGSVENVGGLWSTDVHAKLARAGVWFDITGTWAVGDREVKLCKK